MRVCCQKYLPCLAKILNVLLLAFVLLLIGSGEVRFRNTQESLLVIALIALPLINLAALRGDREERDLALKVRKAELRARLRELGEG
jgi:hypothetical protein